eukprot:COSAG02_NODE_19613_length_873_cov_1.322997_2_plen_61_part_01
MLKYPECEHEAILEKLTEKTPRSSMRIHVARCCAFRNHDPGSMLVFVEQADGQGGPIKLNL